MGADLYLGRLFRENYDKHRGPFDKAIEERKTAGTDKERDVAQERVEELYDRMYSLGYFRDSYNNSSLFLKLELSWWEDFPRFTDVKDVNGVREQTVLTPKGAKALKKVVNNENRKEKFFKNIESEDKQGQEYFIEKYKELNAFLDTAIEKNIDVECSY
tara:strand:+ start:1236 stop:1712 length:477 start_codon:yes stop_codon:yes gene_type:complete